MILHLFYLAIYLSIYLSVYIEVYWSHWSTWLYLTNTMVQFSIKVIPKNRILDSL